MTIFFDGAIDVFYSYAPQDERLRDELEKHLVMLKRQGVIANWHCRKIAPGADRSHLIDTHLMASGIILLLISPDFLASDYCYNSEMKEALERHKARQSIVIPIILRPVDWEAAPFSQLQVLPKNGKPVTAWSGRCGRDKAFLDIALGIRETVKLIRNTKRTISDKVTSAAVIRSNHPDLASNLALVHTERANKLYEFKRYQEALVYYELALKNDASYAFAHIGKGDVLLALEKHEEALASYIQVINLDFSNAIAWSSKGNVLFILKRFEEALFADEQAILFDPKNASNHYNKGCSLQCLGRLEEAQKAFKKAQQLGFENYK